MKQLIFNLPSELAEKFELALQLTGDNRDELAEKFVRDYLATALQSAANSFREPEVFRGSHTTAQARPQTPPPPPSPPRTGTPTDDRPPHRATPNQDRPPRPDYWQEWGKAINRIPRWARKPQQYNHKILRAFFELQRELGNVTLEALRGRCSDPLGHPDTYVPHFDNNFTQMKFDNGNSHGKVFEEQDGYITIWDRISDTLLRYRDYFL